MRIEQLAERHDFKRIWTAFPLHPETPENGRLLSDLFAGNPGYIEAMWPRLLNAAASLGLALSKRTHTYNSRHAHELAKWAEAEGKGQSFHMAVYRAYFEQGLNIARTEILLELVTSVGLDPSTAEQVLRKRLQAHAVDADWQRCLDIGVRAVPTFLQGEHQLVGFGAEEPLIELLFSESFDPGGTS